MCVHGMDTRDGANCCIGADLLNGKPWCLLRHGAGRDALAAGAPRRQPHHPRAGMQPSLQHSPTLVLQIVYNSCGAASFLAAMARSLHRATRVPNMHQQLHAVPAEHLPERVGSRLTVHATQALDLDCARMFEVYHASRESFLYLQEFYCGELDPRCDWDLCSRGHWKITHASQSSCSYCMLDAS